MYLSILGLDGSSGKKCKDRAKLVTLQRDMRMGEKSKFDINKKFFILSAFFASFNHCPVVGQAAQRGCAEFALVSFQHKTQINLF